MTRGDASDPNRRQAVDRVLLDGDRTFVIPCFLSPEECDAFIARSEESGYEDAPITTSAGAVVRKDIRNNERVMVDDPALTAELFVRAESLLVSGWSGWTLTGFNERWRFYRYDPGQAFAPHFDGYYERPNGERSHFTFMVFLNDGFEGGETVFHRHFLRPLSVRPVRGLALVFYHKQLHEGAPVIRGRKYVLRTDVMYRRE
jgi:predicted 2-oxoglutarate/Fe(II)-dependent dioxygenase YbiX